MIIEVGTYMHSFFFFNTNILINYAHRVNGILCIGNTIMLVDLTYL